MSCVIAGEILTIASIGTKTGPRISHLATPEVMKMFTQVHIRMKSRKSGIPEMSAALRISAPLTASTVGSWLSLNSSMKKAAGSATTRKLRMPLRESCIMPGMSFIDLIVFAA